MPACAVCGYVTREAFKFCPECGAAAGPCNAEQRKIVTVLFCDVVASTVLGETTDAEVLRALLARYFKRMKEIVERHGGTVEKFIGDAVMAVFGVPVVHEDDAVRACRAAVEMREALLELEVDGRIGIATGEVVTGTEERLAAGDAVNVAARLQQAAQPGEALIGEETRVLVGVAADVEAVEALTLKGKAEPVPAYRLLAVHEAAERSREAPFVGRKRELAAIHEAWQRVLAEEGCELTTIVGEAGVGKSRLIAEAVSSLEGRLVQGRCLPYGEGITYWPVIEVIKQLDALPSDLDAAASIRSLLRETDEATSADAIAWGFRKLLEEQAPLVCVFDDIQWGEETFLDLVEHVALLSTGAPILILGLARPDLVERRPEWPLALRLEPLPEPEARELIPERLPNEARVRIIRASGGNPLFVTEMVAMAAQTVGEVVVPPTLQALLAARLDQLENEERSVLERGSVEGEIFHRGAVQALSGSRQVTPRLASLVRKGLIRADTAHLPAEDAFRFRHLLIRDVAYNSLPKATRAELHERFAVWLDDRADELVELDEIVGFHLEQAARYKAELGQPDAALAVRAGERLGSAGHRALWRGDLRAAAPLLERALELTRALQLDVHLELDLADAQQTPREHATIAEQAAERARAARDDVGEALALVVAAQGRFDFADDPEVDELEQLARATLPLLEETQDHDGLARVWYVLGGVANFRGRFEEMAHAAEQALRQDRLAGETPFNLARLPRALALGPRPAHDALQALDSFLSTNPSPSTILCRAWLLAMLGRFEEAWRRALPAGERWREISGEWEGDDLLAKIATLAGDHASAADHLRRGCDLLERRGHRAYMSTLAPELGRSLCALGRYDEAEPLAALGRELGSEDDFATQMLWRQVQARILAHRGEHAEAERLASEAVAIGAQTDALNLQGDALCDLAEVLALAGRPKAAAEALEQALARYKRKENVVMADRAQARLAELRRSGFATQRASP